VSTLSKEIQNKINTTALVKTARVIGRINAGYYKYFKGNDNGFMTDWIRDDVILGWYEYYLTKL